MGVESEDISIYYQQQLKEGIKACLYDNNDILKQCKIVEFISFSNGKNRPKRKSPRFVCLFGYNDQYTSKIEGDPTGILDYLAYQALEYLPIEERNADKLIEEVENIKNMRINL